MNNYSNTTLTMAPFSAPLVMSIFLFSLAAVISPAALFALLSLKVKVVEWMIVNPLSSPIQLSLILDPYGMLFSLTVMFISANVMLFTHSYMSSEPFKPRFTYLVMMFILSMNLLIFIPNMITLLIGWDGLGLVSFLLVIYYQNPKSLAAGMITAMTNRIGDVFLLLSIGWALNASQWNIMFLWHSSFTSILSITLLIAAMTKSAQIPFSSWLPAAMAAPTPVSALVHSSTLVTAGIFLIFRFYPFLDPSILFHKVLLMSGSLTALMAGLSAMTECDMKKVIALSTLSQLGVMMVSLALGAPFLAFFHLITHALFKALLFLCGGTLIHLHHHSQDLRFMGHLAHQVPSIAAALLIANSALCGAPFMAGFYSKDMILEFALFSPSNLFFLFLFFLATGLTAGYTSRFLLAVVWAPSSSLPLHHINDHDAYTSAPTALLSLGAILAGSALNWTVVLPHPEFYLPPTLKYLTLFVTILGFSISWFFSAYSGSSASWLLASPTLNTASCQMWFLAPLSSQHTLTTPFTLGHAYVKSLDQGWVEFSSGEAAAWSGAITSSYLQTLQKNISTVHMTLALGALPLFYLALA
uniref:NADH dehydrogenase subunit 5 n=1 Tax=Rhynchospio aff. asiatica ZW-2021 TaxID=2813871 RepID=UPI0023AA4952|nr:NADH dehydrogenase subunit 5 [Rhynchospio aff. asiatica ZW-2021]WCI21129.1 NADH dehydrogenase subunit 5 [Rhynchospio aff. asiatica ZW-2021]